MEKGLENDPFPPREQAEKRFVWRAIDSAAAPKRSERLEPKTRSSVLHACAYIIHCKMLYSSF